MPGLEDLYREIILDHYKNPRNRGELPSPPAYKTEGFNPLCGDQVTVTLQIEDGKVGDIKITGQGCSISQSSASLMTNAVMGKSVEEARELVQKFKAMMSIHEQLLDGETETASPVGADAEPGATLGELEALQGVVKFPVRIKCATLSWNTMQQGLDEAEAKTSA